MSAEHGEEARGWFAKARDDIRAGELVLGAEPPLVEDALFHAQQAAEKSMKGFLTWHGKAFRKVHDLREIAGAAIEIEPGLEPMLRQAARLSPFAGVFRYPTEAGRPTVDEARAALALARHIYDVMLARLPQDAEP